MTGEEYGHFCEIDDHSIFTKYYRRNVNLPRIYIQRRPNNDDQMKAKKYNNGKIIIYTHAQINEPSIENPRSYKSNTCGHSTLSDDDSPDPDDKGNSKEKLFIIGVVCSLAMVISIEYWLFR